MVVAAQTWIDGTPGDALQLPDRAFAYGDGVFETMLLRDGQPVLASLHFDRLAIGLACLRMPEALPLARQHLDTVLDSLRAVKGYAALRLTVSRGTGPRGYAPPQVATPRVVISVSEMAYDPSVFPEPATLGETQVRWGKQPQLAGVKHLNRLEQVLAAADAMEAGVDEVLMLDQSGAPLSVSSGNLFLVAGKRLLTPILLDAGIAGTRRRLLLDHLASACGLQAAESRLQLHQLLAANEVFYCNALTGLRPVGGFRDRNWGLHPVTRRLHAAYGEWLQR
ncbi:aminodeoxychorismate lyase [Haliea sp.]|uniref:aminodeoxychorismate lyase n=1 Tax=Haliea sp. TaxID=1932666 RepID=UPI003527C3EB